MEGWRDAGGIREGRLSAQLQLLLDKRGTLDKSLNLSLPQNPLSEMGICSVMLYHVSHGWVDQMKR